MQTTTRRLFLALSVTVMVVFLSTAAFAGIADVVKKVTGGSTSDAGAVSGASAEISSEILLQSSGPRDYTGQGNNICGQYAMNTVFNMLGIEEKFIDTMNNTNPSGESFTAPGAIYDYMVKKGIDTTYKNNSSVTAITEYLDKGKPVICLVDAGGSPHWIAVIGYKKNDDGSLKSFVMRDSYWGTSRNYEMGVAEFKDRWKKPLSTTNKILGEVVDYSNLLIVANKKTDKKSIKDILGLPGNFHNATNDQLAGGVNTLLNGWYTKKPGQVVAGAAEALTALPAKLLLNLPGTAIQKGGSALEDWGKNKRSQGGVFNNVVGSIAGGTGRAVNLVGGGLNNVGNAISSVTSAGFKKLKGIFGF